jgi:hypothetical protein
VESVQAPDSCGVGNGSPHPGQGCGGRRLVVFRHALGRGREPANLAPPRRYDARSGFGRIELKVRHSRCECERPGTINSGVRGIVAGPPDRFGRRVVERCDICEQFCSDEAAGLEYSRVKGGGCRYDKYQRVLWIPA